MGQRVGIPVSPLPCWQYAIYWRKDGQPLWNGRMMCMTTKSKPEDAGAFR
ncbi:MAG: transglutaminase family protein [Hahellaceae bacterium]|nr:transglutaminase family protein [Hahellaceae bacterium]